MEKAKKAQNSFKAHLFIIYGALAILFFLVLAKNSSNDLSTKVTRLEFLEEATRIRDNIVGFKQVNDSLPNNSEKKKHCEEGADLLSEWSEDIKELQTNFSAYMESDTTAKEYYDSIAKINEGIVADCSKLTNQ